MSFSVGLDVALSGLSTAAEQTAVVSRNVARANDPYATRKIANVVTTANGGIRVASVTRAANRALLEKMLSATSTAAGQQAIVQSLNHLHETIADPELDASPTAMSSSTTRSSNMRPRPRIRSVRSPRWQPRRTLPIPSMVRPAPFKTYAPRPMPAWPTRSNSLNTLLARFEAINTEIVKGTRNGADVTDLLDQRDVLLAGMSEEVGIRTVARKRRHGGVHG